MKLTFVNTSRYDARKMAWVNGGYWAATGEGPMRPIAVEGTSREQARQGWMDVYGRQYEEMERATALAVSYEEFGLEDFH